VTAILVNIFGGIMRCDVIAQAIIEAVARVGLTKPIVCRLKGTNQAEAIRILEESNVTVDFNDNLEVAAKKVVAMS
jgi:succinyl-CoA synthetase beta subunit